MCVFYGMVMFGEFVGVLTSFVKFSELCVVMCVSVFGEIKLMLLEV